MNEDTKQQLQVIKRSFRQLMDGVVSTSMREKGLDYHLNWGVTLPRLHEMADELGKNYPLAIELWKENIRECKILATMIMPPEKMLPEITDIWIEQIPNVEIAEQAVYNLFQHLDYASDKAFIWLSSPQELIQLCGFHTLSRLFMKGMEPGERDINEFIDQALVALQTENVTLRKAVVQSLIHFAELGLVYERIAKSATRQIGMDFLCS